MRRTLRMSHATTSRQELGTSRVKDQVKSTKTTKVLAAHDGSIRIFQSSLPSRSAIYSETLASSPLSFFCSAYRLPSLSNISPTPLL